MFTTKTGINADVESSVKENGICITFYLKNKEKTLNLDEKKKDDNYCAFLYPFEWLCVSVQGTSNHVTSEYF